MTAPLLPCPFCGKTPAINDGFKTGHFNYVEISCSHPVSDGPDGFDDGASEATVRADTEEMAVAAWNRRAYLAASSSPSEMEVVEGLLSNGQPLVTLSQAQSALAAMRAERDAAGRTAQWHAFSQVLDFINTLEEKVVAKKEIYAAVMDMRPATHDDIRADLADFDTLGRHLREVNKAYEAAEAQVLRLTEENEALRKERDRCHDRLEIDHVWVMGDNDDSDLERRDIPLTDRGEIPDGIECRDATIAILEQDASADKSRIKALEEALRVSDQALCDWLNTYAPDMCEPARVAEAEARIGAQGTIAYIADALQTVRLALEGDAL